MLWDIYVAVKFFVFFSLLSDGCLFSFLLFFMDSFRGKEFDITLFLYFAAALSGILQSFPHLPFAASACRFLAAVSFGTDAETAFV